MPEMIALCLEDLAATSHETRYLQCVALAGGAPGLTLAPDGSACWRAAEGAALALWVSADERLCLERPPGSGAVTVRREGRSLVVPAGKPVVLRDGDILEAAGRTLRLHLHGPAAAEHAPAFLAERAAPSRLGRVAAAAAAIGAAAVGLEGTGLARPAPPAIEVRDQPPKPVAPDWHKKKQDGKKKPDKKKPDKKPPDKQPPDGEGGAPSST